MTETDPLTRLAEIEDETNALHAALRAERVQITARPAAINAKLPPEKRKRAKKAEPKAPRQALKRGMPKEDKAEA